MSNFQLKLMDLDSEHLGIPKKEYQCVVKMASAEFQRISRDLSVIGDTVSITVSNKDIKFSVSGDIGSGSVVYNQSSTPDPDLVNIIIYNFVKYLFQGYDVDIYFDSEYSDPITLTFSLRYLNFFTKATPLTDKVYLSLSKDVPLVVEYKIDLGSIKYFLAPKVEEDS